MHGRHKHQQNQSTFDTEHPSLIATCWDSRTKLQQLRYTLSIGHIPLALRRGTLCLQKLTLCPSDRSCCLNHANHRTGLGRHPISKHWSLDNCSLVKSSFEAFDVRSGLSPCNGCTGNPYSIMQLRLWSFEFSKCCRNQAPYKKIGAQELSNVDG